VGDGILALVNRDGLGDRLGAEQELLEDFFVLPLIEGPTQPPGVIVETEYQLQCVGGVMTSAGGHCAWALDAPASPTVHSVPFGKRPALEGETRKVRKEVEKERSQK
jgi:hypothetical protein